jgi:hypothetical protein
MSDEQLLLDVTDKMADVRAKASKFIFALGVEMIVAQGVKEASARALLGKKLKEIGKPGLLRVIIAAALNEVADPRTYIAAAKPSPGGGGGGAQQSGNQDEDNTAGIQSWMV